MWTRLELGDQAAAWRSSQATFVAQVVGSHFESICLERLRRARDLLSVRGYDTCAAAGAFA